MSQPSGIGRISLGSATAGVMLPVLLALGAQLVGPSQRLPDFFTLCLVLGIVLELVALACGIVARRTGSGKAGILIAGLSLMLGLWLGLMIPVERGSADAGSVETVSEAASRAKGPGFQPK